MSQHDFSVTSASDSRRVGSLGDVPTPNVLLSTVGGVVPWLTPTILRRACGEHWPLALALDVEMHLPARRAATKKAKKAKHAATVAHGGALPAAKIAELEAEESLPAAALLPGGVAEWMAIDAQHHLVLTPWDALRSPDFQHNKAASFSLNTRRGRQSVQPAQLATIASALQVHSCISPADEVPDAVRYKRRAKAIERTGAWLEATTDALARPRANGPPRGRKRPRDDASASGGGDAAGGGTAAGAETLGSAATPTALASLLLVTEADERGAAKAAAAIASGAASVKAKAGGANDAEAAVCAHAAAAASNATASEAAVLRRSTVARAGKFFYFPRYHVTEYFTIIMLLLNDYFSKTMRFFSFCSMTEYSTNLMLLLKMIFVCAVANSAARGFVLNAPLSGAENAYEWVEPGTPGARTGIGAGVGAPDRDAALAPGGVARATLLHLPAAALRVWRGHGPRGGAPLRILDAVAAGFDLVSDGLFPSTLAGQGWASTYTWDVKAVEGGSPAGECLLICYII